MSREHLFENKVDGLIIVTTVHVDKEVGSVTLRVSAHPEDNGSHNKMDYMDLIMRTSICNENHEYEIAVVSDGKLPGVLVTAVPNKGPALL